MIRLSGTHSCGTDERDIVKIILNKNNGELKIIIK